MIKIKLYYLNSLINMINRILYEDECNHEFFIYLVLFLVFTISII